VGIPRPPGLSGVDSLTPFSPTAILLASGLGRFVGKLKRMLYAPVVISAQPTPPRPLATSSRYGVPKPDISNKSIDFR
jgi:hypothetical protein